MIYTKEGALRYVGHLDLVKVWERILRRAELPLAFSHGFHPQPRIQFASALPVGCASVAEVMDMILERPLMPQEAAQAIAPQLPPGMKVLSIAAVPLDAPALQASLQSADYTLTLETDEPVESIRQRVQALLDAPTLPRERRGKRYDLRPLILGLSAQQVDEKHIALRARLKAGQDGGAGRPDELLDALGLSETPVEICRTRIEFAKS